MIYRGEDFDLFESYKEGKSGSVRWSMSGGKLVVRDTRRGGPRQVEERERRSPSRGLQKAVERQRERGRVKKEAEEKEEKERRERERIKREEDHKTASGSGSRRWEREKSATIATVEVASVGDRRACSESESHW